MTTKGRILTIALGVIVLAGGLFFMSGETSQKNYQAYQKTDKTFYIDNEEEANESAKGGSWYLSLIRANPFTGQVNATDVKKAINQAETNPGFKRKTDHINWQNQGPDNVGGRTRAIVVDNKNNNRIYAGGVSGGLWRSTTGGASWNPVSYEGSDKYKSLSIVCMEQASNGDIYFGTGEQGFAYAGAYKDGFGGKTGHIGMGIWKSTDNGETWKHIESTLPNSPFTNSNDRWNNVHELAIDPNDPQRIFAATDRGLMLSENGGDSWNAVTVGENGSFTGARFLEVNCAPSPNGNTIYAATSSELFRSKNNGSSFSLVNDGNQSTLPTKNLGRIETAISPSDPDFVYVTMINPGNTFGSVDDLNGIFQTRNNGDNWNSIAQGGGAFDPFSRGGNVAQGRWDNVVAVDPTQKNHIYVAGIQFWQWDGGNSFDGRGQWSQVASGREFGNNNKYLHVDHHEITFNMNVDPPVMYIGNDGGIFRTKGDFTAKEQPDFKEINTGYNTTQFYAMDASARGDIIGGTQDNNTVYRLRTGFTGKSYEQFIGGDGFYCEISDLNNDVYIGENQGTIDAPDNVFRSQDAGNSDDQISFEDINDKGAKSLFNTPFRLYENANDTLSNDSVVFAAGEDVIMEQGETFETGETFHKDSLSVEQLEYFNNNPVNFSIGEDSVEVKRNLANVDPTNFDQAGSGTFRAKQDLAELPGTLQILSNNGVEFNYELNQSLEPLESIKIQDPVRTFFTMPLRNEIWLTDQMLNFGVNPTWFKLTNVNMEVPMTLDYTPDGNTVFVGGWDNGVSRIYRISGLRHAYFKENEFDANNLDVEMISTFQNVVTGVEVDNNDESRLLVTCGNYATGNHVFYSENAMDTANVNFEVLDDEGPQAANLADMPVYDGLFRMDSANQVFVGTEMGIWFLDLDNRSQGWVEVNNGMPRVPTHQLRQIKPAEWAEGPRIYAATHGRGIYFTTSTNANSGTDDWNEDGNSNYEASLKVYPNPASDYANIAYEVPNGAQGQLQVVNMQGQILKHRELTGKPGEQEIRLSVSSMDKGQYILRMSGNDFEKTGKLSVAQ